MRETDMNMESLFSVMHKEDQLYHPLQGIWPQRVGVSLIELAKVRTPTSSGESEEREAYLQ